MSHDRHPAGAFASPRHVVPYKCCAGSQVALVANLKAAQVFVHPEVEDALLSTDRAAFVQPALRVFAYGDAPSPLGNSTYMSAPHLHAASLQAICRVLARPTGSNPPVVALDLGCGSGYLTAALAHMVNQGGRGGRAYGVDIDGKMVSLAEANCRAARPDLVEGGVLSFFRVDILSASARHAATFGEGKEEGCPRRGASLCPALPSQFDAITVGMELPDDAFSFVSSLLAPGGQMVAGFRGSLVRVEAPTERGSRRDPIVTKMYDGAGFTACQEAD